MPGQLGQGAQLSQSGFGTFGVEDSHALRTGQERTTGTPSQIESAIGRLAAQSMIGRQGSQGIG